MLGQVLNIDGEDIWPTATSMFSKWNGILSVDDGIRRVAGNQKLFFYLRMMVRDSYVDRGG